MLENILYYSTNKKAPGVSFRDALLKGLAPDKGLYMPEKVPSIPIEEILSFAKMQYHEIAFAVGKRFLHEHLSDEELMSIVKEAYNFDIPLEKVYERKYIMRLDHGPTASFKDFAARMMGRLMQHFLKKENRKIVILTATSGDTGSAIANAFYGLENIKVVILYPEKEVTDRQRMQMTTLQKNIQIIAINGKFDDCQAMVKKAFIDPELRHLRLSSANSINIGRLIPQSIYYFYAFAKLNYGDPSDEVIFSVPSGNFGNLMGGLIAKNMGLPVKKFIISTNENDEVPIYFATNLYSTIVPSVNCISSAMNVGHPSNMARIVTLYGGNMNEKGTILFSPDIEKMKADMFAVSIDDNETKATIKEAYSKYNLLLEPHGSVAWTGLNNYFDNNPNEADANQLTVCLETAHPAKFPKEIKKILSIDPELPNSLKGLDEKEESYICLENDINAFKKFLKTNY